MKKILQTVCFGMLLAAGTFTGCSNMFQTISEKNEAVVANKSVVSFSCGSIERTALPTVNVSDYTYELKGTIKGGKEESLLSNKTYNQLKEAKLSLIPGEWSFTLTASKEGENILSDTESATLTSGSSVEIAFMLYAVTDKKAKVSIKLNYPKNSGVATYFAAVYESATATDGVIAGSRTAIGTDTGVITYENSDVPTGVVRYVRIFLYDTNGTCIGSVTDAVYTVFGLTSSDEITLGNINCFSVTVNAKLDGVVSPTLKGKTVTLVSETKTYSLKDNSDGTYTGSVPAGSYDVYVGNTAETTVDTDVDLTSNTEGNGSADVEFFSITTDLCANVTVATSGTNSSPVLKGTDYSFVVTADDGYTLDTATITTTSVSKKTNGVYTISDVTTAQTIKITGVTHVTYIYASGEPLLIVDGTTAGYTTIYIDSDGDGEIDSGEKTLYEYNNANPKNNSDLSKYTVYGGWTDSNTASTKVTMKGGKIAALYGGCNNNPLTGSSTIIIRGGTVTGTVSCAGSGDNGTVSGAKTLTLSGNPVIGNGDRAGILLSTIDNKYITVDKAITGKIGDITLIGDDLAATKVVDTYVLPADTIIAKASDSTYVTPGKFILRRDGATYKSRQYNNTSGTVTTKDIVVAGGILVPDLTVGKGESFDYDGDNTDGAYSIPSEAGGLDKATVTLDGTIFSAYIDPNNGYFKLSNNNLTLNNAYFDMAVMSDSSYIASSSAENYYTKFNTSTKFCYVQFRANAGERISMEDATNYLRALTFTKKTETSVNVKLCLETVDIDTARVANPSTTYTVAKTTPDYFNGSFYTYVNYGSTVYWNQAYDGAKVTSFNGMKGYLMTVTSAPENNFIYYKCFGSDTHNAWLGGTRFCEKKVSEGNYKQTYDTSTWENVEEKEWSDSAWKKANYGTAYGALDAWYWACGPEAGMCFYNKATYARGGTSTMYTNWNNQGTTDPEPNDYPGWDPTNNPNKSAEICLQFVFVNAGEWNDISYNQTYVKDDDTNKYGSYAFVIEYTPYETDYGRSTPDAWAIAVEKTY